MATTLKQLTQMDIIIKTEDQTAEGTESAGRNLDSITGKAQKTQDALNDTARAGAEVGQSLAEGASRASDGFDKMGATTGASLAALRKNINALRREEASLNTQLDAAMQAGGDTSAITEKLSTVQASIKKTSDEAESFRRQQEASRQAQRAWNGTLGEAYAPMNSYADVMERAQAAQQGLSVGLTGGLNTSVKSFLRMAASAGDEVAGLTLKLTTAEDRLQQMQVQAKTATANGLSQGDADYGVAAQEKYVTTLRDQLSAAQNARRANEDLADSQKKGGTLAKLESYQIGQLTDEAHKFFDQVMAGGSTMQAAFYQVPNMVQVMGGFGASLQRVSSFVFGPAGLVAAGAAGGLALFEMGKYAESEASKLSTLGQQMRATRADAVDMAGTITAASKNLGGQSGWTDESARTAAISIGGTYNFNGTSADIQSIAGMARDVGAVFGSLEDGLKAVKTAMENPSTEIQALYKQHLPGVDQALVEQVKNLQAASRQGDAYALVIGALTSATRGAYDNALTPFQRAMEDLKKSSDPVIDSIKNLSESIGTYLAGGVTNLLNFAQGKYGQGDMQYAPGTAPVSASGNVSGTSLTVNRDHPQMVGLMGINTDYKSKYNPTTLDGNIDEGINRFLNFFRQTGDLNSTLALYGGAKPGSANASAYIQQLGQQVISKLPPVIAGHIDAEAEKLGASPGIANIMKMIAMTESSGKQWQDQTYDHVVAQSGADSHAASAAIIDDQRSIVGGAAALAGGYSAGSWTQSRSEIDAYIQAQQKLQSNQQQGSQAWAETAERITTARIALANTLSPQEQITQGLKDQGASLNSQTGYWRNMAEVVAQFGQQSRGTGVDQTALAGALAAKQQQLAAAYNDGTVAVQRQVQSQQAIAAVAGSSAQAIQHATNYQQAYNEAWEDFDPNSQQFADAVKQRTAALDSLADAQRRAQQIQQNAGLQDNLSLLQAETGSIGMNAEARQVMLARMQAEIQMHRQYGEILPQEAQDYVSLTTQVAQASAEYERQQQVLEDVTGSMSGMFDQLSNGLTQGFVQGTSAGISYKNMLKGMETQIASRLIKFALINPMLNSIDGKSRTTLSDIATMLNGSGASSAAGASFLPQMAQSIGQDSTSAGGSGVAQAVSNSGWAPAEMQVMAGNSGSGYSGSSASSAISLLPQMAQLFGNNTSSSTGADLAQAVSGSGWAPTETQAVGSLSGSGGGTYGSGVNGSSAAGGFGSISDMFSGTGGLMSSGGMQAAGTLGGAASMAGGVLGGVTAGYSVGKMASNLTGGGKGGKIGAAVGSGIGTVVGTVFGGPIGGMIGGVVLGTVGGIIGGLFNKSHWSYDAVTGANGQLVAGANRSKHSSDDITAGLNTDLGSINAAYSDAGISVVDGDYGQVGHYHKGKKRSVTTLQDLLPNIKLHSDDATENLALQQLMPKSFDSVDSYTQAIQSIKQMSDTLNALHVGVRKFDDQTHLTVSHITGYTGDLGKVLSGFDGKTISISGLESLISSYKSLLDITNAGSQSIVSQVEDLREKYQQAADQAKLYGLDYQVILDKGAAIAAMTIANETTKLSQSDQSVTARYLVATGDQEGADLLNQQVSAAQGIQSLQDEWRSYLGDSYADNVTYQQQLSNLEKTQAAERLHIQQSYAEKAAEEQAKYLSQAQSSVSGVFSNMSEYVRGLGVSDASPLSVQDQYRSANDNFSVDYQAALGGDYNALSRLQSESQTVLSVDQKWLGSGTDYASAYQDMLTKLQAVANLGADTFTANLAKQLSAQQVDATLQVRQVVEDLKTALVNELRQTARSQSISKKAA